MDGSCPSLGVKDLPEHRSDREQGKVSLEVRVHLGAVEHCLGRVEKPLGFSVGR